MKAKHIPLEKLEEDPMNVRSEPNIDPTLVEDIKKGQIEPLIVRPKEGEDKYLVTVGSRRFTAAKAAGLDGLKCEIREDLEGEDAKAMYISCRENAGSEDLPTRDYRNAVKNALKIEGGDPHSEEVVSRVAGKLGLGRTTVIEHIKTLELDDEDFGWVLDAVEGELPLGLRALTKEHSDRSDAEKEAVKKRFGKSSEEIPNVVEESKEISSAGDVRSGSLGHGGAVNLSRRLKRFKELSDLEQGRVVLENIVAGNKATERIINAAEKRTEERNERRKKKSTPRGHKVAIKLDDDDYGLLRAYADSRDITSVNRAADSIVRQFLYDNVKGHPNITVGR
ncbi:hypothetical protein AKJ39_01240 [candidate division MSBL1 archaeon SCGC-AAA259J03]|uniref:ParB-like N-terminal domain-containing protein n=1 Tax=candidate division MSBL1 archaeon SCGC-AAA259J03 TaxID=1698269 RepID=A0A656YWS7_9EURY|nr:hypothetical protein AKJ39_01240 [candidate division MSBL1 archaeon SCGC-AAA259J03]